MPKGIYQHKPHQGYQKGHPNFHPIPKGTHLSKKTEFKKGHRHSPETISKIKEARARQVIGSGDKNPNWKGNKIRYSGIHAWLIRTQGKATKCENIFCSKKSKNFDWAKIRGKQYRRIARYYAQLCRSCHVRYDQLNETIKRF